MKDKLVYLASMLILLMSSCSIQGEPSPTNEGSPRDWVYGKDQVKFYINDIEQTLVTGITVRSLQLPNFGNSNFPWYDTTLKVKGLLPKGKLFNIEVKADVERFEGSTVYQGIEYDVTGVYTGSPFEHYKDMGIIVYLKESR